MKILTAYFSLKGQTIAPGMKIVNLEKGHTATAAEFIRRAVGGDLFEIQTVKTYIEDHMKMIYEAKEELEQGVRPALKGFPEGFAEYDTVFLGYPNWWNTLPMPVVTFLEGLDWNGKRVIPFNTSEGSGLGKSVAKIREICKGAVVEDGYALKGSQVDGLEKEIAAWAKARLDG